jgi:hypothetical protein
MGWMPENTGGSTKLDPHWQYREGMTFITVLPETTRRLVLLTGIMDPTGTWAGPKPTWVHEFKHGTKFSTVVCNKWNEACVFCYENEIYKIKNPEYKQKGGKLPYGLSLKALVPVYDVDHGIPCWLFAGKRIQEGMDFILRQHGDNFSGSITIYRSGRGTSTAYRVDAIPKIELNENQISQIKNFMPKYDGVDIMINLSHKEIIEKSNFSPVDYFKNAIPSYSAQGLNVDISGWGPIPNMGLNFTNREHSSHNATSTGVNKDQSAMASPQPDFSNQPKNEVPNISKEITDALSVICTVGVYGNQNLESIIRQTGKPYISYLMRSGSDLEIKACAVLIENWEEVDNYIKSMAF